MLQKWIIVATIVGSVLSTATLAQQEPQEEKVEPDLVKTSLPAQVIKFDGLERTYRVFVPSSYNAHKTVPLLVLLHGGGSDGRQLVRFTGFNRIAEDEGMIVVTPDGIEKHWNDGRVSTGYLAHEQNVDDVGFISKLIDLLKQQYRIDSRRVYVSGISNGGMMTFRLGIELPEKIAAIAPVVAALPEPLARLSSTNRPIPAVIINGTEDPLVNWDGGEVRLLRRKVGRTLSVPDSVKFWANRNHCIDNPQVTILPDNDPGDGMRVVKTEYTAPGGADVTFYAVEGGGHTWHGPRPFVQYLPAARIGRACRDFDATEAIWAFFSKHAAKVCVE